MVSALVFFFSSQRIRAPAPEEREFRERPEVTPIDFGAPTPEEREFRERPEVTPFDFDSSNTNQFIHNDLISADPGHQIFDYGALPLATVDSNGTVPPTSSYCSTMETLSQVSGIPTERNLLLLSNLGEPNQDGHGSLHQFSDVEYLKSLPCSVLKELSKNVAKALATAKQVRKELVESTGESNLQVHGKRAARNTASKSSTTSDLLRCEHPGCTTTFRRNKDRLRHFRSKHESNAKTFRCPVVDCPSGFGHVFTRSDKLRDHLRAEKTLNLTNWCCVLPGCSEILGDRAGLIDHLGQHDYGARHSNRKLITDYGFAYDRWNDYLLARYICSIPGCPFGTYNKDHMNAHLSIHHDGPFCPCPIPSCQRVSQDYESAFTHLAREHDYNTRSRFRSEVYRQSLEVYDGIFLCPICHKEMDRARRTEESAGVHCQKHDHQELLRVPEALIKAWNFAFGSITHGPKKLEITGDMILPYIILSYEERKKLHTEADFEQALAKIRAAIEPSKSA
ncbi:hypothetical protein L207DRAFT_511623 [Hyaloscypha variabilis F]|uniref:C2H2-type domain-containing protein n=1 Tax=Hyaloscypha variabilis (strain UAMH 11265 / GT02V1 / F) TaxID=1149755 RepID=A0A2J6RTL5_HYAVF|nr:hypothetical protein L207DRAFT_511623 [Hyaloscypha variabilis F]